MMAQKRILVIDDEQDLCDILLFNLRKNGYEAMAAHSGEMALKMELAEMNLILLDVMMPGMSGFELAKTIKNRPDTAEIPIIFITAKDKEDDTLKGFGLGADDYITKPFSTREVMARVNAVLHRTQQNTNHSNHLLSYEGLILNKESKTASIDQEELQLTRTEFDLLQLLLDHKGQVFSRKQLISEVWPSNVIVTRRTVDVNITRLRKKLKHYAPCIITRQGFGYCFAHEETIGR